MYSSSGARFHTIYYRPAYEQAPVTALSTVAIIQHGSKAERELQQQLYLFGYTATAVRLRREEANRKAMSDAKSRAQRVPDRGRSPTHRRLQTAENAMAARLSAGRCR